MFKYFFILWSLCTTLAFSQVNVAPRISPHATVSNTVGYTVISIDYSSPGVRGRNVFGGLEDYDALWRAGANEATVMNFSTDVTINNHLLPAGSYSFFIIPSITNEWTLIFNTNTKLFGTNGYDSSKDALRTVIAPNFTNTSRERLVYDIESNGISHADITLNWSYVKISFTVKVDYQQFIEEKLQSGLEVTPKEKQYALYYALADFFLKESNDGTRALNWIDTAIALTPEENIEQQAKNQWLKAQLLAKSGQPKSATMLYEQLIIQTPSTEFVQKNLPQMRNIAAKW